MFSRFVRSPRRSSIVREEQSVFKPPAIDTMARAFNEACNDLKVFAADQRGREIIAVRIIDLARQGLSDPEVLRDCVVNEKARGL